jgi:hypothetical protein
VKSNVRHIGKEETGEGDYDYCIAFFNRRTKQTEFKPVSFLRVEPRNKSEVENSGLLEGKLLVPEYILSLKKLLCVILGRKLL